METTDRKTTALHNTNVFCKSRREANTMVDRWRGRGYVGTGLVYNPEYAEQEGHPNEPYVVVILDDNDI